MTNNHRCGQFILEVAEVIVPGAPVSLRVPVRRCKLAEHMIQLLNTTERGASIAAKIRLGHEAEGRLLGVTRQEAEEETIRAAFGPDLEAIHPFECTEQRCLESCTPSYKLLMRQFGFYRVSEQETGVGCTGKGEVTETA